jgi:hypothetical protein
VRAKRSSPWDTDPEWMFKKTALKQLCKLLPVSTELQRALGLDDRAEINLPQDLALLADENETPTPESEDGTGDPSQTIDSVDTELALVPEEHRAPILAAFDALQMNKAQRLVQLRSFKGPHRRLRRRRPARRRRRLRRSRPLAKPSGNYDF